MKFNNDKFNLGKFNIQGETSQSKLRLIPMRIETKASKAVLRKNPKLKLKPMAIQTKTYLTLAVRKPLKLKSADIQSGSKLTLTVRKPLKIKQANIETTSSKLFLRFFGLDTISLTGLTLYPNETLIIDTDKITVYKDGVNVVEYWKTGSKPFKLGNGNNKITVVSSDNTINANMSVVWQDRWL